MRGKALLAGAEGRSSRAEADCRPCVEVDHARLSLVLILSSVDSSGAKDIDAQSLADRVTAPRTARSPSTSRRPRRVRGRRAVRQDGTLVVSRVVQEQQEMQPCSVGPVQVRLTLEDGVVHRVQSWVGPLRSREARDLGVVSAAEGARYLMTIAARGGPAASSKAIFPAVLADSAVVWPALLAIARDPSRVTRHAGMPRSGCRASPAAPSPAVRPALRGRRRPQRRRRSQDARGLRAFAASARRRHSRNCWKSDGPIQLAGAESGAVLVGAERRSARDRAVRVGATVLSASIDRPLNRRHTSRSAFELHERDPFGRGHMIRSGPFSSMRRGFVIACGRGVMLRAFPPSVRRCAKKARPHVLPARTLDESRQAPAVEDANPGPRRRLPERNRQEQRASSARHPVQSRIASTASVFGSELSSAPP